MNIKEYKKEAELIRDNETYRVFDLKTLDNITLSLTELNPGKMTGGHSHDNVEEIYMFFSGKGKIEIDKKSHSVKKGDVLLIPKGSFHKVHNEGFGTLKFWTIFEKYKGRGLE